jgi:hypothetical protein
MNKANGIETPFAYKKDVSNKVGIFNQSNTINRIGKIKING